MSLLVCRSCLGPGGDLIALKDGTYTQLFMDLAGITVNERDGLPQSICIECAQLFTEFSLFREKVVGNHQFLVEALEQRKVNDSGTATEHKLDQIQIEVKEERLDGGSSANMLQADDGNFGCENVSPFREEDPQNVIDSLVRKKQKKVKKKSKSRKTTASQKPFSKIPRAIIKLDPDKITTLRLSVDEQRKRHEEEAKSAACLTLPHRCEKCFKGFNYERKLTAHIEKYHKKGAKYECAICQRTMVSAASLALHAARHDTLYECRACAHSTPEKKIALAHYQAAHEGVEPRVQCRHCGQSFRHRSTLNGHMRSRHPSGERPTCHLCSKNFASKDSLLDHLLIHTGEKAHACETCGKRFRLKAEVVVHARTHATTRPYYCQPCDKHFKTHTSFNNHQRLARPHIDPARLSHVCQECGRAFAAAWQLRAHAAAHGSGGAAHACPQCGARLSSRAAVRKHVRRAHLRIPPPRNHVCHTCGKTFSGRLMLENHIRIHTGDKPFECGTGGCGARFSQKSTLHTHIRLVHLKLGRAARPAGHKTD